MSIDSYIDTETVQCDLCGGREFKSLYQKSDHKLNLNQDFDVIQCSNCELSFINPQPLVGELSKLYPKSYYEERDTSKWLEKYEVRYSYLKDIPGKNILDIGCAKGDFLNYLKKYNYNVTGYEELNQISPHSFPIYSGAIDRFINSVPKQDIVTAWGVLEHLQKPSLYFDLSQKVLRKGGVFLFLVTNIESITSRYLYTEDIPRHMTFFSPKTIQMYAEKYGFTVKKIYHRNDIYSMPYIDSLNWFISKLKGKQLMQYETINFNLRNGKKFSKVFMLMSRLVAKVVRFYEKIAQKNGIITVVLEKQ